MALQQTFSRVKSLLSISNLVFLGLLEIPGHCFFTSCDEKAGDTVSINGDSILLG